MRTDLRALWQAIRGDIGGLLLFVFFMLLALTMEDR
jgi:hypothetical protein